MSCNRGTSRPPAISGPATAKSKASFRSGWKRSRRSRAISRPVSPLSAFRLAAHWPWLWRRAIAGSKPLSTSSDFCRRAWSELRCPLRLFCMGMLTEWCQCPTPKPSRDWSRAMGALSRTISIPAKDMACLWRAGPTRSPVRKHSCASTSDKRVGGAFVEDRDL